MKKLFLLFIIGLLFIGCNYSPSSDINDNNITYIEEGANKFVTVSYKKADTYCRAVLPTVEDFANGITLWFAEVKKTGGKGGPDWENSKTLQVITVTQNFNERLGFEIAEDSFLAVNGVRFDKDYSEIEFIEYNGKILTKYINKAAEDPILSNITNETFVAQPDQIIDCSSWGWENYTLLLSESEHFYVYLARQSGGPSWSISIHEKIAGQSIYSITGDWAHYWFYEDYALAEEYYLKIVQSN